MSDWYISSAAWTAIAQFAASTSYTVGQIVRPLTAPAAGHEYAFRCTTAGTSSTEPTWPIANNSTVTTGGATFTNVSGQSAYGWSAAAGTLYSICASGPSNRILIGDRVFCSSDHGESQIATSYWLGQTQGFGLIQIISVNRAGSVPPAVADILAGATISNTAANGNLLLEAYCDLFWQGFTFVFAGSTQNGLIFDSNQNKAQYLKNCTLNVTNTNGNTIIGCSNSCKWTLDNTTVQFGQAGQSIVSYNTAMDMTWINTASAIPGATIPAILFRTGGGNGAACLVTCRGVDLSAVNTTLVGASGLSPQLCKVLLDSCKIATGVTRLQAAGVTSTASDEIELVNCHDGTNVVNERHTPTGDIVTDRGTYLTSGAQDDIGNYSLKLASSSRSDFTCLTLDNFWLDVENTLTGASKTATIEIISFATLNNNDVRLLFEYMGTSGNSIASFVDSLASVLTPTAALSLSSNTWTVAGLPVTWNPADLLNVTLSGANLIMTGTGQGGARANVNATTGKYYFEYTMTAWAGVNSCCGLATASVNLGTAANSGTSATVLTKTGILYVNGVDSGAHFGSLSAGATFGIAVDFGAQLIWYRVAPSGNWNASGTANPATGTGGVSISALTGALYPAGFMYSSGDVIAVNFGAASYSGTVPSGFSSFPLVPGPSQKQLLQVTFTPQRAGRVRGLVRLGKPSTTVWADPRITIT